MLPAYCWAQVYNPFVANPSIAPSPMAFAENGGTALLSFSFGNSGTNALAYIPNQEVILNVSLSRGVPNNPNASAAVSGSMAQYFSWTWDVFGSTLVGTQNQVIPANVMGLIIVDYKATSNSLITSPQNGFNVNVIPSPTIVGINSVADDDASAFTYTVAATGPQPVDLINFHGQKFKGFNLLNWTTISEENSQHFNLYYGKTFDNLLKIAEVSTQALSGNSHEELNYTYQHNSPVVGDNYYRLSSVDINGSEDFHNTINLYVTENATLSISPNPAKNGVNVRYTNGDLDMLNLILSDMQGKTLFKKKVLFENGSFTEWIPLDNFPIGTYLLNITDYEGYTYTQKVLKN